MPSYLSTQHIQSLEGQYLIQSRLRGVAKWDTQEIKDNQSQAERYLELTRQKFRPDVQWRIVRITFWPVENDVKNKRNVRWQTLWNDLWK